MDRIDNGVRDILWWDPGGEHRAESLAERLGLGRDFGACFIGEVGGPVAFSLADACIHDRWAEH